MNARKMALCGLLCALAEVCLLLGGLIPVALYCSPILAMAALLPVREECGVRMALTAYAAVAVLSLLLAADKELAGVYLFLGWYPAAQPALDALRPRAVGTAAKLLACNLSAGALYALLIWVFRLEAVAAEFRTLSGAFLLLLLLMANLVFLLTDRLLHRLTLLWRRRLRSRWFR